MTWKEGFARIFYIKLGHIQVDSPKVIPTQAGIQKGCGTILFAVFWTPAFAGVTVLGNKSSGQPCSPWM
jgi:hypothetical protein